MAQGFPDHLLLPLVLRTYQSSKYTKTTAESDVVKVTIADTTLDIKQTTRNQFIIEGLNGVIGLNDVKVEEIVNTIEGDKKVEYLIKDVFPAADNKSATVELFYEFNDGGKYEITVDGFETGSLIASKGEPKSIKLFATAGDENSFGVLVGTDAPILYKVYDANGIDVTLPGLYDSNITYTIKYTDANYEDSAEYLTFAEVGDKAIVTASFCSYEIDENGEYTNEWTSKPFAFYGVDKAATAIQKIADWEVVGGINKRTLRLVDDAEGSTLKVDIRLTDNPYAPYWLTHFGQVIADNDGNEIGTAFFTSLNPDTIEVYDIDETVELEPRRKGTGRIMVSYKTIINDVEVSTPINVITVEVDNKSVLDNVSLNQDSFKTVIVSGNRVIISSDPAEGSALEDPEVTLTVKDQYGVGYGEHEIVPVADGGLVGKSKLAEEAIGENNAIWVVGNKLVLNTEKFNDILTAEKATAKTFQYTLKVKDTEYGGVETLTFTVDVRNPISNIKAIEDAKAKIEKLEEAGKTEEAATVVVPDEKLFTTSYKLEVNKWAVDACGGNVARIWANDGSAKPVTKTATFMIWDMKNSAKYDELPLTALADKKDETIQAAETGAYYMVFKDGVNITKKASVTDVTGGDYGNGTMVTLKFSTIGDSKVQENEGREIVVFNTDDGFVGGAGKYEFVYYEIKESNGKKKLYQKQKYAFTTTVDAGKYTFVKRDAIEADCDSQAELLKCFTIKDRNGNTYNKSQVVDSGVNGIATINGVDREFHVNIDYAVSNEKSVFVDSITFWEDLGDADVEYTVDVKMFIDKKVD